MLSDRYPSRIGVIDIARFYAIALVFYGHFIEEFMLLKNPAAADQYRFVYSFHMVLFIVIAGTVAKSSEVDWRLGTFLKHRFFSRLLPFCFFTLVMMVPPIFFDGKLFGLELPSMAGYLKGLLNTAFGLPFFCVPSWFLLLIIGVELVHYCAFRYLRSSDRRLLLAALAFYLIGYIINLKLDIFNPLKGRTIGWNYFFIHEAITLYAFYLIGIYLRRRRFLIDRPPGLILGIGAGAAFIAVVLTYRLNNGPFNFPPYRAVVILFASHGHILWFPLTALAGCGLIFLLARLTPNTRALNWLGQNTLILMCLNGIFYHYINAPVAKWSLATLPHSGPTIFVIGCLMTVVSLAALMPLVYALNRWVPQLVGKPKVKGPFFRNWI
ncbi:MAG: acyltransferase family protein [Desulfosarcinaceae bacterium]|jgi:acyltransferase